MYQNRTGKFYFHFYIRLINRRMDNWHALGNILNNKKQLAIAVMSK